MKKHQYRITVESQPQEGSSAPERAPLSFVARCHDDILAIVERSRQRGTLPPDDAAAMAVGLKLLGEIVLEHRNDPLYSELSQGIGAFIKKLKSAD